jgi:SPP1 family predicted phage head-tail adaptor
MRNGVRRNKIEIQHKVETGVDDLQQKIYAWQAFVSPFVEIVAKAGQEHFDQQTKQLFSQIKYRFRCNFLDVDGVDTTMRITFESKTYDIRAILPDLQRREDCVIEATLQDA